MSETSSDTKGAAVLDSVAGSAVVRVILLPLLVLAAGAYVSSTLQSALTPIREQVATMSVELKGLTRDVATLTTGRDSLIATVHALQTQVAVLGQRLEDDRKRGPAR
ncbi:MAG: hypothetical protein AABY75_05380 [Bacteroidota bacterium]